MPTLNKEFAAKINACMYNTANTIYADMQEACACAGEKFTNAGLIEGILDCDRHVMYGNDKEASDLILEAIKEHGYEKVEKFCRRHFKFV